MTEVYPSETNKIKEEEDVKKDNKESKKPEEVNLQELPSIGYFTLQFSLMGCREYVYYFLGILGATCMGVAFPLFAILFGETMNDLGHEEIDKLTGSIGSLSKKLVWCGLGMFGGTVFNILFSILCGESLKKKFTHEYFKALMRQEQGYYDSRNVFEYSTKVQAQIKQISSGLGTKVGNTVFSVVMFISAYVVGFIVSWKLSLVLCSIVPLMVVGGYLMVLSLTEAQQKIRQHFEEAGGIAEEVLYHIKTVASFANFDYERKRFQDKIHDSYEKGKTGGMKSSLSRAFVFFLIFGAYALAIGVGSKFIADKETNGNSGETFKVGDILTVIFTIIFGSFSLGQAAPNIKAIAAACEASREFFYLRDRKALIDVSQSTDKPEYDKILGKMEFVKIAFAYPSKPDRLILKEINLKFEAGTKTAIVGQTGSGKSTIVNLIERLYDPIDGEVLLDNMNIKKIDLEYLRSLIGYVPQEPVLINTSLRENIIFGRENVTEEEIQEACEKAYINDFVQKLDKGLDTKVGIKGSKLSGGQKQRVAIARAILKKPKILILDEATSALDYKSEKIIKKSLDIISRNTTTIIIAHRLSTIKNADQIVVLDNGEIKEIGNHETLAEKKGLYYLLIKNQETADNQNKDKDDEEDLKNNDVQEEVIIEGVVEKIRKESEHIKEPEKELKDMNEEERKKYEAQQIKLEIQRKKMLVESAELSLEERKKIMDDEESLKEKQFNEAKKLLWPIMCENPWSLVVATIFGCLNGTTWPVYGFLLAETIFKLSNEDSSQLKKDGAFLAGMFLIVAGIAGIANFFVGNLFTMMGEYLAMRMRQKSYAKYLSLHMAFYDYSDNSPGALMTKLASDTIKINGIALSMCAVLFETLVTLIIGIILGFVYCWQLALICLGFVPFMVIAAAVGMKMQMGYAKTDEIKEKDLGNLLSESVTNTKSIYCYNMQEKLGDYYGQMVEEGGVPYGTYVGSSIVSGLSQFLMFGVYALTFYVGSVLVKDEDNNLSFGDMLRSIFSLLFAAFGLGMVTQYLGDMDEARKAMISLYNVLSTDTEIDPELTEGKTVPKIETFVPKIEFRQVHFRYPTRPDTEIFKGLSFVIEQGQHCAFVGFSGSGKSTIIQLLLRFYDVDSGEILVNDINIKDYSLHDLRKFMGIVMQEPVLFKTNVYNNINYGNLENTDTEKVLECARKALVPRIEQIRPDNTDALPVSGGEKQRIAIARCMLRDPKILLLDEATSALDKNVEEEVQAALDNLMVGRTTIVIAHRLSTIVNCDKIFFLEHGEIKEFGTHMELLEKKGRYHSLFKSGQTQN